MSDRKHNESREICVYYNSACPVCRTGIEYQKEKAQQGDIFWGDIHLETKLAENLSTDLEILRKYLHVTDRQGKVHIGVDAFIVIWRNNDTQVWLVNIFSLPIINPLAKAGYYLFANTLYWWNRWKKRW